MRPLPSVYSKRTVHLMNNADAEQTVGVAFWLGALAAGINALVSMGFAVATVASGSSAVAWYAADRAAAFLGALVVVVALRYRAGLLVLGWALAAVQAIDAIIGVGTGAVSNVIGPAVLALVTAAAMIWLARRPY